MSEEHNHHDREYPCPVCAPGIAALEAALSSSQAKVAALGDRIQMLETDAVRAVNRYVASEQREAALREVVEWVKMKDDMIGIEHGAFSQYWLFPPRDGVAGNLILYFLKRIFDALA